MWQYIVSLFYMPGALKSNIQTILSDDHKHWFKVPPVLLVNNLLQLRGYENLCPTSCFSSSCFKHRSSFVLGGGESPSFTPFFAIKPIRHPYDFKAKRPTSAPQAAGVGGGGGHSAPVYGSNATPQMLGLPARFLSVLRAIGRAPCMLHPDTSPKTKTLSFVPTNSRGFARSIGGILWNWTCDFSSSSLGLVSLT